MYENFNQLLMQYGVTPYKVSKETGVSQSTLSDWKRGISTPKMDKLQKLADYFGVPLSFLLTGEDTNANNAVGTPVLKQRDIKDINAILSNTKRLLKQDGLMFNGDPASPEAVESILSAMEIGMKMAKKNNKKYTPKKYK
jgi:transcriptional regulator with XRE-family HTH domain